MDLTAATADLSGAVADAVKLLPVRAHDPVLSAVLITADSDGVTVAGTDTDRTVVLKKPARTHTDGTVLVPGRPLADTLRALDVPEVRLTIEGNRLAIRTPRARFALPLLETDRHPGIPTTPEPAGHVGTSFTRALTAVAGAASKDDALPLFSGVRIRSHGTTLRLIATDRYRLAVAELGWNPTRDLDVLIPATFATEIARQAAGIPELTLHADMNRATVTWPNAEIGTSLLATPFPDESRYLGTTGDAQLETDADALLGAVRRVGLYADGRGAIELDLADNEVRVRSSDTDRGEADESIKATVHGHLTQTYRAGYLVDALRTFANRRVTIDIKTGMRSTVLRPTEPDDVDIHYVVMPILRG